VYFTARAVLLLIISALAWFVWQQPAPAPSPAAVRSRIPALPVEPLHSPAENSAAAAAEESGELWRVVTRRFVTPEAARTLSQRLQQSALEPIMFENREPVEMHAFDDLLEFSSHEEAIVAKNDWLQADVEAGIIKIGEDHYTVGLGRLFHAEYADELQKQLKKAGKPYRYQRRNVTIPVWRLTFAPGNKQQAENIWRQLQSSGISMPVLMPEKRFQETYNEIRQQ